MKTVAHIAPPPPAFSVVSRVILGGIFLAALFLGAPQAAAQTPAHTFTLTGPATITETDSDANTRYTLTRTGPAITEGAIPTLNLNCIVTAGTAVAADFSGGILPNHSINFTGSVTNRFFDIGIAGDNLAEDDETFTITCSIPAGPFQTVADANGGVALPADLTVTIPANDGYMASTLAIAVDDANTAEGDTAEFTVTLTVGNPDPTPVTVDWAVSGDVSADDHDAGGGTLSFTAAGSQTIDIAIADDFNAEAAEDLTVTLSNPSTGATFANAADNTATTTIAASPLARRLTLTGPATAEEGEDATYTVSLTGTAFANPALITWTVTHGETAPGDFAAVTGSIMFPTATTFTIGIADDDATAAAESAESFSVQISTADANANAIGAPVATTIGSDDDPAAREARLEAPVASVARGVGVLVAEAVRGRLRAGGSGGPGGNSLTLAGRELAGAGAETLAAEYLAGGYFTGDADISAAELLRRSGFSLAGGDGVRGFNFWGSGGHVSADGDHDGVDYDGDTSAFHLGVDTGWRDGLVGVAVARSDGDTDFTVTADGMKSTLETTVTSVHPYLTRRLNRAQLWLTAGHGSGDAELREPDAVIKTDITVTTAALGATFARDNHLSAGLRAIYTRAALDAATGGGRQLPKTTAATLRLAASGQANWTRGAWSPFATFTVRHDSGDADTGIAGDLGGGVEWRGPGLRLRLAAATSVAADSADEQRATLSVNKSSGNFALSLNLAADDGGIDTARLLHGEWRF